MTHTLTTTMRRKQVPVKYVQQHDGVYKVKGADGMLYQLAEFTCDAQFLNFCNAFNIRDSRRNNTIQAA
jgi:hypothetical protein